MPRKPSTPRRPKPNHLVEALSLDSDPTDRRLLWLTIETKDGLFRACLERDTVEALGDMVDQFITGLDCDCPECTAAREAEGEVTVGSLH